MSLTDSELEKVCSLAKLECQKETKEIMLNDINAIMNFVEKIQSFDTKNLTPMFHPFDIHQQLREDVPSEKSCLKELESIAPLFEDGHFLVPKVIEDN